MKISLRAKNVSLSAMMLTVAMLLSYIESMIPLTTFTSIPGLKLGLANLAVMLAFYFIGPANSAVISLARVMLSSILFGSISAFWFSLAGAVMAYSALLFSKYILRESVSYIGVSMLCAACHNLGQIAAAALLLNDKAIFIYLPYLLILSLFTGALTGMLMFLISNIFYRLYNEKN